MSKSVGKYLINEKRPEILHLLLGIKFSSPLKSFCTWEFDSLKNQGTTWSKNGLSDRIMSSVGWPLYQVIQKCLLCSRVHSPFFIFLTSGRSPNVK